MNQFEQNSVHTTYCTYQRLLVVSHAIKKLYLIAVVHFKMVTPIEWYHRNIEAMLHDINKYKNTSVAVIRDRSTISYHHSAVYVLSTLQQRRWCVCVCDLQKCTLIELLCSTLRCTKLEQIRQLRVRRVVIVINFPNVSKYCVHTYVCVWTVWSPLHFTQLDCCVKLSLPIIEVGHHLAAPPTIPYSHTTHTSLHSLYHPHST